MSAVRTFEVDDCALDLLLAAKQGRTVSVCIPCRDEAATIGWDLALNGSRIAITSNLVQ